MKLMVVSPYFYPKIGGMENYAYNISKGLKEKHGWDVVVVTSNHINRKYREDTVEGIKIYRLPYWFKISNTPVNPLWYFNIQSIIKKEKPDIINGHMPVPFIADLTCRLAKKAKIPFILTYQNDLYKNNLILKLIINLYYLFLGNQTIKESQNIIITTGSYGQQSNHLRKDNNKIKVIPPGIHLEQFEQILKNPNTEGISDTDKVVLFVGQLDKTHSHKGIYYLIQAMKWVLKQIPESKLVIVGKGDGIPEYKNLAHSLSLEQKVIFTDYIPEDELIRYYHRSDVVILPSTSDSEGFGIILIEAGACKKPVIGTSVGGIPYVIDDDKTGLLVPPKSPEALSNAIIRIITDNKLAKTLGKNGYKKVRKEYRWKQQVEKTHKIFVNLLKQ